MIEANERVYRQRFLRKLKKYFQPGMKVLDAGCGPGIMSELFTEMNCKVTGIDLEEYFPDWGNREQFGIRFKKGSTEKMEFEDGTFDAVWMQDAMHHMAWPEKTLAELVRVAKKDAPVVIVETNRQSPITYIRMTLIAGHITFNRRQFKRKLDSVKQDYSIIMIETRCLPWKNRLLLGLLNWYGNVMEAIRILNPWLTYQVGILKGMGHSIEPVIDNTETEKKRKARIESEAICR